jgi:hypothetical protein
VENGKEVKNLNKVGKYAQSDDVDELQLMNMVFELPEKDRMIMWMQDYIDIVIEKMPPFAKNILEVRKAKWEDTKEYIRMQISNIVNQREYIEAAKRTRKEFALYVKENYPHFQSLLFRYYDGNLNEMDFRKFVYHRRFGQKRYLP